MKQPQKKKQPRRHRTLWTLFILAVLGTMFLAYSQLLLESRQLRRHIESYGTYNQNLITEVGEVKQENLYLRQTMDRIEQELELLKSAKTNSSTLPLFTPATTPVPVVDSEHLDQLINFLILGTHDSLTDTIILASVNASKSTITLVSVPRDLAVSGRRINEVYYLYGIDQLKQDVEDISGLAINYYAVVNLQAFKDIVDIVGGIDIVNQKAIVDAQFPTSAKGYTLYSLSVGTHHLDGTEALKYVRSRKSTSDFDRSRRQQDVLEILQGQVQGLDLRDMGKLFSIYATLSHNIDTDISLMTGLDLMTNYRQYTVEGNHVLSDQNYLMATRGFDDAYLLIPRAKDFTEIQGYIQSLVIE